VRVPPVLLALLVVATVVACKDAAPPPSDVAGQVNPQVNPLPNDGSTDGGPRSSDAAPRDGGSEGGVIAPGPPSMLGAHALAFQRQQAPGGVAVLSTPPMSTATGRRSTIVVSVGRGAISAFAKPTDNKNPLAYPQLGATHAYTQYPSSGTALYALTGAQGGSGHVVSTSTPTDDELTLAAVEVVDGRMVQDFKWNEVAGGNPITSLAVTTTGPATLVAFWWGDAGVAGEKTATPNNGFTVVESILRSGALVQCAVATKTVSAAGTYDVTWTSTPIQGAQLWLAAVQ